MNATSHVTGVPRLVLRAEGAALLAAAALLYGQTAASWWLFALLFFAPDLSFLGYLGGPRIGAVVYNAAHSLVAPLVLAMAGLLIPFGDDLTSIRLIAIALIWTAHIGFDRLLGYGLKYSAGFGYTHLGRIGRTSADET